MIPAHHRQNPSSQRSSLFQLWSKRLTGPLLSRKFRDPTFQMSPTSCPAGLLALRLVGCREKGATLQTISTYPASGSQALKQLSENGQAWGTPSDLLSSPQRRENPKGVQDPTEATRPAAQSGRLASTEAPPTFLAPCGLGQVPGPHRSSRSSSAKQA